MKCMDCNEELLAENAELCPYCSSKKLSPIVIKEIDIQKKKVEIKKLEKSKQFGRAAKEYENLGMQQKANAIKKLGIIEAKKLEKEARLIEAANIAPQWNPQLAMLKEKELARGNCNRATLAVARKLVIYMLAVDRRGKPFMPEKESVVA